MYQLEAPTQMYAPQIERDLPATKGVYIGVGGNLRVKMAGGGIVTFNALAPGIVHPLSITRVLGAGTTASDIRVMGPAPTGVGGLVLGTRPANLLAYWPLSEIEGNVAYNLQGDQSRNGVYLNSPQLAHTTFLDGSPAPSFNGVNNIVNIYSPSLATAFDGSKGALLAWFKVRNEAIWNAGNQYVTYVSVNTSNRILFTKGDSIGWVETSHYYIAGGTAEDFNQDPIPVPDRLDWSSVVMTWDKAGDSVRCWVGGGGQVTEILPAQSGLGVWAGQLNALETTIGGFSTASPQFCLNGWISNVALWDAAISEAEAIALAAFSGN